MSVGKPANPLNSIILKTAAYTLLGAFVLFSYGIAIFAQIWPQPMASFADAIGARGMSAMYYERIYKRSDTPQNLYLMLDKYIAAENHAKIIRYAPKLIYMDDQAAYQALIDEINDFKFSAARADGFSAEFQAFVANEDNRLVNQYIRALLAKGKLPEAEEALAAALAPENARLASPSTAYFTFISSDLAFADVFPHPILVKFKTYFDAYEQLYNDETEYNKLNARGKAVADQYYEQTSSFFTTKELP